jgi:class 3 adenylate cyclase
VYPLGMTGKRRVLMFLAPLLSIALLLLLDLEGLLSRPAGWFYDAASRLRPPAPASRELLLLDVDDRAVAVTGAWPWTAEAIADGLVKLKEFDAERVVFDLPLPGASPAGPSGVASAVSEAFDREFSLIAENVRTLFDGIRGGSVLPRDAATYVDDLVTLVDTSKARLLDGIAATGADPGSALPAAARAFGRVWIAWELRSDSTADHIPPVLFASVRGDGFSGPVADEDGVLRSGLPVVQREGRYLEQAAFAALLERLGGPSLRISGRRLVLGAAQPPGMPPRDIVLDLTEDGTLLLDWPGTASEDGFRHLSWGDLAELDWLEEDLGAALRGIAQAGFLGTRGLSLLDRFTDAAALRDRMLAGDEVAAEWLDARASFFSLAEETLLPDAGDGSSAAPAGEAPQLLLDARRILAEILRSRAALREALAGSFCIVSLATPSVPGTLGRTPRGAVASRGSASATLVNTVLTARRLAEIPRWCGKALGLALSLLATIAVLRLRVRWTLVVGLLSTAAAVIGAGALLATTGWYLDPVVAAASPGVSCAALAAVKALARQPVRRSLRRRFAPRVSKTALGSLLSASARVPAASERNVTVLCAQVGNLPRADGSRDPAAMAGMLNRFHAAMARIVVGNGGTVGRAEGDAIEACFGAPLEAADGPRSACRCAVKMQAAARDLAASSIGQPRIASPFNLRIGIAAGGCLVGDLGMPGLPGYTALGAARDAALQLVSVCDRFGSATLATAAVWEEGGKELLARMLDRVPLAIEADPVRCFELVGELEGADATTAEAIGMFNEGLALFEGNDRARAGELFRRVLELLPDDGPAALYAARCRT